MTAPARAASRASIARGLTFDDVLLVPRYSETLPAEANTRTRFSRGIELAVPIVSAAMDTVTDHRLAVALAKVGGIGVIHRNLAPEAQAEEVQRVKESGATGDSITTIDREGRLRVAAAIGVGDGFLRRVELLVSAGADALVIDTAHAHSHRVLEAISMLRSGVISVDLVAGNVATRDGAQALIDAGVDGIKVGIGPGSICTTRIVAGVGVPQLTAILECAAAAGEHDIPLVADGGIRTSGDIVKALAAGASTVMMGRLLAATDESPGRISDDNSIALKEYRAMGSLGAMSSGSDRYPQSERGKFVPEGVEAAIRPAGPLSNVVFQMIGGLRAGMGYCGASTIRELQATAQFIEVTAAGQVESHPHDLDIRRAAPNYP